MRNNEKKDIVHHRLPLDDGSPPLNSTFSESLIVVENTKVVNGLSSSFYSSETVDYESKRVEETILSDQHYDKYGDFLFESFYSSVTVDYDSERVEEILLSGQLRIADFPPSPICDAALDEKGDEMSNKSSLRAMGSSERKFGHDFRRITTKELMESLMRIWYPAYFNLVMYSSK